MLQGQPKSYSKVIRKPDNVWAFDSATDVLQDPWDGLKSELYREKQLDKGDLHGNFLLLLKSLLEIGLVSLGNPNDYNELVRIEAIPPDLVSLEEGGDWDSLNRIINCLKRNSAIEEDIPEKIKMLLYGDVKGDRGSNDLYTKLLRKKLRTELNISTPELLSNHTYHTLAPEEKTITDESKFISYINEQVLVTRLLEAQKITQAEIDNLEQTDLESLQLVADKLDIDANFEFSGIQISTHAFEGTEPIAIQALARYFFGPNYSLGTTATQIAQTIRAINVEFSKRLLNPQTKQALLQKMAIDYREGEAKKRGSPAEKDTVQNENPFYALMWSYEQRAVKSWPLLNNINPSQTHGHVGQADDLANQSNMDGNAGGIEPLKYLNDFEMVFGENQLNIPNSNYINFQISEDPLTPITYTITWRDKSKVSKIEHSDEISGTISSSHPLWNKLKSDHSLLSEEEKLNIIKQIALRHRSDPWLCAQQKRTDIASPPFNPLVLSSSYSLKSLKLFLSDTLSQSEHLTTAQKDSIKLWANQEPTSNPPSLELSLEEAIIDRLKLIAFLQKIQRAPSDLVTELDTLLQTESPSSEEINDFSLKTQRIFQKNMTKWIIPDSQTQFNDLRTMLLSNGRLIDNSLNEIYLQLWENAKNAKTNGNLELCDEHLQNMDNLRKVDQKISDATDISTEVKAIIIDYINKDLTNLNLKDFAEQPLKTALTSSLKRHLETSFLAQKKQSTHLIEAAELIISDTNKNSSEKEGASKDKEKNIALLNRLNTQVSKNPNSYDINHINELLDDWASSTDREPITATQKEIFSLLEQMMKIGGKKEKFATSTTLLGYFNESEMLVFSCLANLHKLNKEHPNNSAEISAIIVNLTTAADKITRRAISLEKGLEILSTLNNAATVTLPSLIKIKETIATTLSSAAQKSPEKEKAKRLNKVLPTIDVKKPEGQEIIASFSNYLTPDKKWPDALTQSEKLQFLLDKKISKRLKRLDKWLRSDKGDEYKAVMQQWIAALGKLVELRDAISKISDEAEQNGTRLPSERYVKELFEFLDDAVALARNGKGESNMKDSKLIINAVSGISDILSEHCKNSSSSTSQVTVTTSGEAATAETPLPTNAASLVASSHSEKKTLNDQLIELREKTLNSDPKTGLSKTHIGIKRKLHNFFHSLGNSLRNFFIDPDPIAKKVKEEQKSTSPHSGRDIFHARKLIEGAKEIINPPQAAIKAL